MTTRLYYDDAYALEFGARVVGVSDDRTRVVLDRTAFYPSSGGQPHDIGTLAGIPVVEVVDEDDRVVHVLAAPLPATAEEVAGVIDGARRHDHMRQHTAQHLLSAILDDEFRRPTVSFHLGADSSSIDVAGEPVTAALFAAIEARVNAEVLADRPVTISYHDAMDGLRLRKPTERPGRFRVVTIDGLDVNACGGTHVRRTGELGLVLLLGTEKIRQTTRIGFVAGERALRVARANADRLAQAAAALNCAPADVAELAARQRDAVTAAEKALRVVTAELGEREGADAWERAEPTASGRRLLVVERDAAVDDRLRAMVQAFVRRPGGVALVAAREPRVVLLAAAPDAGVDANALLGPLLRAAGGKGGGSPVQAQGSVPDATHLADLVTRVREAVA